jgi:hypothetical protein
MKYSMKKTIIIFPVLLLILIVGVSFGYKHIKERQLIISETPADILSLNIRPEIKSRIDKLFIYRIATIEHTTKDIGPKKEIKNPEKPNRFLAGKFKISFINTTANEAVICQTEENVGHLGSVIPGKTKVGGYVQLLDNPADDNSSGPKLNPDELDYFIQTIYKKFTQPLDDKETRLLNQTKDYALAIMFSDKQGIDEYHAAQLKKPK